MHVFIVGSFWNYSLESSYRRAFEALGRNVTVFDWDERYASHPLAKTRIVERISRPIIARATGQAMVNAVARANPDLVLVVKGRFIQPESLHEAKRLLGDRPLINFNPDSPWEKANSTRWLIDSLGVYDAHFTWSLSLLRKLRETGVKRTEYLPFAYDPSIHFPVQNIGVPKQLPAYDAVFVGTYDPVRDKLLSQLGEFKVGIWGNDWHRSKLVPKEWIKQDAVYGAEATRLLDNGIVSLNLLRVQNLHSHNMRTFEIPATAHTMLTDRTEEHLSFFREGSEIECFADVEELKMKIRMLAHNSEAGSYGQRAYERVKEETYEKRARTILAAF